MPINLSVKLITTPKSLSLSILFLLFPIFFHAQALTGLWIGVLSNDSTTTRKDQSFEIALTEYKGKVYGYSRSEFIVNDTLYYIVKRVKGIIEGDACEVTDEEIIAYNFRGKLDKGIKVTSTFRRNKNDSTWYLDGTWKTNATRKYYSVTGKVSLEEEKDLTASKIFPHLEELNKANEVAFYKERREGAPIVKIVKPERIKSEYTAQADPIRDNTDLTTIIRQPDLPKAETKTIVSPGSMAGIGDLKIADEKVSAEKTIEQTAKQGTKNEPIIITDKSLPKTEETVIAVADKKTTDNTITGIKDKTESKSEPVSLSKQTTGLKQEDVVSQKPVMNKSTPETVASADPNKSGIISVKTSAAIAKEIPALEKKEVVTKPVAKQDVKITKTQQPVAAKKAETKINIPVPGPANPVTENKKTETITTAQVTKTNVAANTNTEKKVTVVTTSNPVAKKPAEDVIKKSAVIEGRKSEFSQEVNFKSDSLFLSLYDNGEIDGDTVSIYMNGDVIMPRQGLKSAAIRKTIYLPAESEEFTLVMFAESLGTYPPNTGLLVIRDGDDVYNLRFSSDFQKSSGILFRRKK